MYLSAIENGQLATYYPQATSGFLINLYCKYEPDEQGIDFLCKVKDFLNDLGYDFRYTILAQYQRMQYYPFGLDANGSRTDR